MYQNFRHGRILILDQSLETRNIINYYVNVIRNYKK